MMQAYGACWSRRADGWAGARSRKRTPATRSTSAAAGFTPPTATPGWQSQSAKRRSFDKTPPPWAQRPSLPYGFPIERQREFIDALNAFFARQAAAAKEPDRPASELLEPGNRWNGLIGAINSYISGGDLDQLSVHDLENYDATNVNWRVAEGYGATIAAHGANVPAEFGCIAHRVDHRDKRLKIETSKGAFVTDQAIVALPTAHIADETLKFTPALPGKIEAAAGLPLGLADKLFVSLDDANEFPSDSRVFGRNDRAETGAYHVRPFGRPLIEAYLGGSNAWHLEEGGERSLLRFRAIGVDGHLWQRIR